jgi:hypothetical protein
MSRGVEEATKWDRHDLLSSLVERIQNESALNHYPDWPNIEMVGKSVASCSFVASVIRIFLFSVSNISELWFGAPGSSKILAVVFGEEDMQQNITKVAIANFEVQ